MPARDVRHSRVMTSPDVHPWDFAEPERVLHDIAARIPLRPHQPILALVADAAGVCEVNDCTRVQVAPGTHWNDASYLLEDLAEQMVVPDDGPRPRHSLLLVAPRPGRVVFGPAEEYWLRACRYVSLPRLIVGPNVALVTEHGWRFHLQRAVGADPRLERLDALSSAS